MNAPTTTDRIAAASRRIGAILHELEQQTGVVVASLKLEQLETVAHGSNPAGVTLSVQIGIEQPRPRAWERS